MDGRKRVLKTVDKPFVITLLILVMGLVVLTSANAAVSAIPFIMLNDSSWVSDWVQSRRWL